MEKISVIIPTYNRGDKIENSIRSVLNQTYQNVEVLVIDDASTDDTEKIVHNIRDERLIYIRMPENGGASAARNEGVRHAMGEWIAFHDSDDVWRLDKLEKQIAYRDKHKECDLIYTAYLMHLANGEEITVPNDCMVGNLEADMYDTLLQNNTIGAPTILMRKSVFNEVGGFDTSWNCLEDWDFVLRVARNHYIGYVNEPLLDAYQSEGSVSSNVGVYYTCYCRLIAQNRKELIERGLFDTTTMSLFRKAKNNGVIELVQKLLVQLLLQYQ